VISDLSGGTGGHNLSQLVNITLNDKAYMLGYCWQASGQNLPFCGSAIPTDGQIYAFQVIIMRQLGQSQSSSLSLHFEHCFRIGHSHS